VALVTAIRVTVTRACATCGGSLEPRRSTRRYCSNGCRQRAYRARRLAADPDLLLRAEAALEVLAEDPLTVEERLDLLAFVVWPSDALAELCAA
jgi:ABC-type taurine transport system ATPase subunit